MPRRRNKGYIPVSLLIYGGVALAAIAIVVGAYFHGRSTMEEELRAAFAQERLARQELISGLAIELGTRADMRAEERAKEAAKLREVEESWKGKVKSYVPSNPERERNCPVTTGWVQYHDERASGMPAGTGPPSGTAETPSGIGEAEALETIGRNYAKYDACKARVRDILQEFDDIRSTTNSAVTRMNERIKRIERKLQ